MQITLANPRQLHKTAAPDTLNITVPDFSPHSRYSSFAQLVRSAWRILDVQASDEDLRVFAFLETKKHFNDFLPMVGNHVVSNTNGHVLLVGSQAIDVPVGGQLVATELRSTVQEELAALAPINVATSLAALCLQPYGLPQNVWLNKYFNPHMQQEEVRVFTQAVALDFVFEDLFVVQNATDVPPLVAQDRAKAIVSLAYALGQHEQLANPGINPDVIADCLCLPRLFAFSLGG